MPKTTPSADDQARSQRRMAGLIIQTILLLAGIFIFLYLTTRVYVIQCQKDAAGMINCTLRDAVLGLVTVDSRTVTGLAAAAVVDDCQGAACSYRLELYDNQGAAVPLEEQYSADNVVKEKVAKRLNEFITDPTKTEISLREQVNWMVMILPVTVIGMFVLYRMSLGKGK